MLSYTTSVKVKGPNLFVFRLFRSKSKHVVNIAIITVRWSSLRRRHQNDLQLWAMLSLRVRSHFSEDGCLLQGCDLREQPVCRPFESCRTRILTTIWVAI
jgi:hypothetical protein